MGSIYKRTGFRNWYIKYIDCDGRHKYRSTRTTDKTRARKLLAEMEKAEELKRSEMNTAPYLAELLKEAITLANDGKLTIDKTRQMLRKIHEYGSDEKFPEYTLAEWIKYYRKEYEQSVSESHRKNSDTMVEQFRKYLGRTYNKDINLVSTDDLRKLVNRLKTHKYRGKTNTSQTINSKISYIKTIFKYAHNEGIIERNVATVIQDVTDTPVIKTTVFSTEELKILCNSSHSEWSGVCFVAATTGIRLSNAYKLKVEEIDLKEKMLIIEPVKQRAKSAEKKKLFIPILDHQLKFYKALISDAETSYCFPNFAKKSVQNTSTEFSKYLKQLFIPKLVTDPTGTTRKRTFHSLRHTFNSNLSNKSVPIEVRKHITGHEKDVTNMIYTHPNNSLLKDSLEKLPHILD